MVSLRVIQAGDFSQWLRASKPAGKADWGVEVACGECVGCCTSSYFIHIEPDEHESLSAIPRELLFPAPGMPGGFFVMGFDERGHCPMLKHGQCSIYSERPRTCRHYDCRVLSAANLLAGGQEREAINRRVREWNFQFSDNAARRIQRAIENAALFLTRHQALFPVDSLPSNPSQLARLAISVHTEFLDPHEQLLGDVVQRVLSVLEEAKSGTA